MVDLLAHRCNMIRIEQPGMSQTDRKVMRYSGTISAENTIFATTMGPQEAFTVAKIQAEADPALTPSFVGPWPLAIGPWHAKGFAP